MEYVTLLLKQGTYIFKIEHIEIRIMLNIIKAFDDFSYSYRRMYNL